MTFWFDSSENELVGNNLGQYVEVADNGTVTIDCGAIVKNGSGVDKLLSIAKSVTDAVAYNATEEGVKR
jgi:hypothetical protein